MFLRKVHCSGVLRQCP